LFCTVIAERPVMINDDPASPAPLPSSANRLPVRDLLGLVFGRDVVQAPGTAVDDGPGPAEGALLPPRLRLFVLSFLMLFVELALIRWSGALVIYLSYFSNFVLLGSFLGIGIGFLRARARVNLFPWAPVALALLILFVRVFPVEVIRTGSQILFFGYGSFHASGPPTWVTLPIVFLAVAAVMATIGEGVARTFVRFRPLDAYRLDIAGSIAGIAAFSLLSFLDAKPVVWALIVALVMLLLYGTRAGLLQITAAVAIVLLLWSETLSSSDIWSPYYRISVTKGGDGYGINVNGIPHQNIIPARQLQKVYSQPYLDAPGNPLNNVLIIGAGTGDDVANALLKGARHIDAVEIDPQLYQVGKRLNPDHPYQDPRVSVHINDGRAFLEQTHNKYDMILFALPDSLTLVAGQSSLRLESYLFTLEAVQAAKAHLNPGDGLFAMYNYYRTPWLRDRLANTVQTAFGHAPCVDDEGFSLSMISDTVNPSALRCGTLWHRPANVVPPATDNHPFVYLDGNSIPWLYRVTLGLILLASIILVRSAAGPYRRMRGYLDLFFMGAAFMLLETKNIVQFALLFGTTWFVNALVTAGVLVAVFAAVEVSRRVEIRRPALLYAGLLAALVVAWAVPPESLLSLSLLPRFVVAVIIAFAPIFLANMVFAQRFRNTGDSTTAFGANLLGAIVGGVLEYLSLIVGYRWLLVVVALLYGLAFLTGRGHLRVAGPTAGRTPQPAGRARSG
jgi:Spermine/spermidine synthase domain